jgi:hypothetical protein
MHSGVARTNEDVMTGVGIQAFSVQAWAQLLSGIRIAFGHTYVAELLDVFQVFGNAYRLASVTVGDFSQDFGRFTAGFCQAIVARMIFAVGDRATHRSWHALIVPWRRAAMCCEMPATSHWRGLFQRDWSIPRGSWIGR